MKLQLHHKYVKEGEEWPGDESPDGSSRYCLHIDSRKEGTGLDVWWIEEFNGLGG